MTDPRIEAAARALFLAHPLSNKEVVDACWDLYEDAARAALAAADNAATITTVEGLDALPVGAVVKLKDGTVRLRTEWSSGWASGWAGDDYPDVHDLPARVILFGGTE